MIFSMLVVAVAASQQASTQKITMTCAVAVHVAVRQASKEPEGAASSVDLSDLLSTYSGVTCTESRKTTGRVFVTFFSKGLVRDGGLQYVVEPSLEARRVRSIPCEDHPDPHVCE